MVSRTLYRETGWRGLNQNGVLDGKSLRYTIKSSFSPKIKTAGRRVGLVRIIWLSREYGARSPGIALKMKVFNRTISNSISLSSNNFIG